MNHDSQDSLTYSGSVEGRWILSVLDDSANALNLLSHLTPDILQDRVMDSLDAESYAVLKDHFLVEAQWHQLAGTDGFDLSRANDQTRQLYADLDNCLADSVRSVARVLKRNPSLSNRLRELAPRRSAACLEFINTFGRLRKVMAHKLRMTAEDERAAREKLAEVRSKEEECRARLGELEGHLQRKRGDHRRVLEEKERKIEQLRHEIESLTRRTEHERAEFEREMHKEAENVAKIFKQTEGRLLKELAEAQSQLENDGAENYRRELGQHRKQRNMAEELEKKLALYDRDLSDKHNAITTLTDVYANEARELKRLDGYFEAVDAESRRQAEELATLRQARDAAVEEHRKQHQATALVQQLFFDHQKALAAAEARRKRKEKRDAKEAAKAGVSVAQMERMKKLGMWHPPRR